MRHRESRGHQSGHVDADYILPAVGGSLLKGIRFQRAAFAQRLEEDLANCYNIPHIYTVSKRDNSADI